MGKAEGKVEFYFTHRCECNGMLVRKLQWIARRGAPDRIVIGGKDAWNKVYFVELKAPGKPLEDHQEREHKRMREHGADVRVIDSVEGVDAFVEDVMTDR